ncbi:MAG: YraN family protein [Candidatus Omnitrophota bacterium]|jgi:putative endonuclease|nr:MAG: YraN family protein [Candidatus Omnitrophota bacterium]
MQKHNNVNSGLIGENIALGFLKDNGYNIITRNYRKNSGEIDIIAKDNGYLCFIEVKSRRSCDFGRPAEFVSVQKQSRISRTAAQYLRENKIFNENARFDVVCITGDTKALPKIELIKNAFEINRRIGY